MARSVPTAEVVRVFESWRRRQQRPRLCRLTDERRDLIRRRLALGYTEEDLAILFEFAFESDEPAPRFWRGDNPRCRKYLGLDNLLRKTPLGDRIEQALAWREDQTIVEEGIDLGPMGQVLQFRRR